MNKEISSVHWSQEATGLQVESEKPGGVNAFSRPSERSVSYNYCSRGAEQQPAQVLSARA